MKKLLIGVGIVLGLLIIVVVAAPFLVPVDVYKGQIISRVKDATGRDLTISGPIRLSVFPSLGIEANNIGFANAPGAAPKDMATLGKLRVAVKPWPLLHGALEIESFVLIDPVITLEIDKNGHPNWVFGPAPSTPTQPAHPPASEAKSPGRSLAQLQLDQVEIDNGLITYIDQRDGKEWQMGEVGLKLALPSLDSPFHAEGQARFRGETMRLILKLASPRALEDGKSTGISMALEGKPLTLDFNGEIGASSPPQLQGTIDLKVPSVRALASWMGSPLALEGKGLGPLAIKGKLALAGAKASFSDAQLSLDQIKAKGDVAVETGRARPLIKARLAIETLDMNPYLPATAETPPPASPQAPAAAPTPAKASEWSDEPLNLGSLKALDAEMELSAGTIRYRKLTIGDSVGSVRLEEGRLALDLTELQIYQGKGQAKLMLDGAKPTTTLEAQMKLAHVAAAPLLRDSIGVSAVSGTGAFDLEVKGHGVSERAIIGTLTGKGSFALTDGAITGLDLAAIMHNPKDALLGTVEGKAQKTDFAEMTGTFTILDGLFKNSDLLLKSPLLEVRGEGSAHLPDRTLDYRLTPELVARRGIKIAVEIDGPWDHLRYRPELGDALRSLVPAAPDGSTVKPADLLKGLLRGK
ncbi:MAG TPA: AsmA family protein [Stellaceae bacterium]|nr:AsmA family protein [Stellaceae bacterium]